MELPAEKDPRLADVAYESVEHDRARSLDHAAELRGLPPSSIIKTMVVRRSDDDHVFVLVPGDRVIDWPKLRALLGERRLSMPDADEALEITGYERGTITPFGAKADLPVVADERVSTGTVSIGGGSPGCSLTIGGTALVVALDADVADVTKRA